MCRGTASPPLVEALRQYSRTARRFACLSLLLAAVAIVSPVRSAPDACDAAGVRPVAFFHGFLGSPLYENGNPLPMDVESATNAVAYALPLEWSSDGVQGKGTTGPSSGKGELPFPTLDEAPPLLRVTFQAISGDLEDIVKTWQADPSNPSAAPDGRLFYPVTWDWRRDLWEQSDVVQVATSYIHNATGCKPVLVGHSYGGRLVYTALAKFGAELAGEVHAVLYAGTPFQPFTSVASPDVPLANDTDEQAALAVGAEVAFSWPSNFGIALPAEGVPTGVSCGNELCGRPAGLPAGEPFFLPLDLTQASTWAGVPLGLARLRAAEGAAPLLTDAELLHLQFALNATQRFQGTVFDPTVSAAVRSVHPPAALMVFDLTEAQLGLAPVSFLRPSYLECNASAGAGDEPPLCGELATAGFGRSDGLVPTYAAVLPWAPDDVFQVFNYTEPPKSWFSLAAVFGADELSPHAWVLNSRSLPAGTFVNCSQLLPATGLQSGPGVPLEDLLCSLMARGSAADAAGSPAPDAPDPSSSSGSHVESHLLAVWCSVAAWIVSLAMHFAW